MPQAEFASSKPLVEVIADALDDGKAVAIRTLDVVSMTTITDYMVIASGRSNRQVRALTDRVLEAARNVGVKPIGIEGQNAGEWVLVDFGDVVLHLMQPEARDFYQLEKLWDGSVSYSEDQPHDNTENDNGDDEVDSVAAQALSESPNSIS